MPHRQLLAAALAAFCIGILMQPVRAATDPTADAECRTPERVRQDIAAQAPDARLILYRGTGLTGAFVAAMLSQASTAPPLDIPPLATVEAFDPGSGGDVMVRLFGLDNCDIGLGAYIPFNLFHAIQAAMGNSA